MAVRIADGGLVFEWDVAKNKTNVRKHGIDFAEVPEMFRGALYTAADVRKEYGEERWLGIGSVRGRVFVVVFAQPVPSTIRVISLRKATTRERKYYEKAIQDGLEES